MSFATAAIILRALRAHRHGATIYDMERWISDNTPDRVPYSTIRHNLLGLHSLGVVRFTVEAATHRSGGTIRRRWFARKIENE